MPRPVLAPRTRNLLTVGLTACLIGYALLVEIPDEDEPLGLDDPSFEQGDKLRIISVKPDRVAAGGAVTLEVSGLETEPELPIAATLGRDAMRVLHHAGHRLVVQVPTDAEPGAAKLRITQGERRSKPRVMQVRNVASASVLRNVIGGMALLILGLRTVARALRASAGRALRAALARLTQSALRGGGSGVLLGALTQSTTSASALAVSLTQAYLLTAHGALALLIGAQFGSVAIGVLVPLAATREALWVIAVGVLWVAMADNRRSRTVGKIVLGCGLLFYGLRLLRTGFLPLFSDPQVLPYLVNLSGDSVTGLLTCAAAGALLCVVFQGPGPVYGLVLSLAESSGLIGVHDGLAILCGTALGSVVSTLVLGWPYGKRPRTLAAGHALLGAAMTFTTLLGLPLWTALAQRLIGNDPTELAYGAKALFPNVGAHLAVGFMLAQLCASALCLAGVALAIRLGKRLAQSSEQALARARRARESQPPRPASLSIALDHCLVALDALRELSRSQEREPTVVAEHAVREASAAIEVLLENREPSLPGANVAAAAMSAQHLLRAVHGAVRVAEQALERGDQLLAVDAQALESMHSRIEQGLDAILVALQNHTPLSAESAQAREIGLNASEADARRQLLSAQGSVRYRLWLSELFVAYEAIGNHLYRLHMALTADVDDDLG
jgi:hypothetical protein